jgi:hypothetical protein
MVLEIIVGNVRGDLDGLGKEIDKFLDSQLSQKGKKRAAQILQSLTQDITILLGSSQQSFEKNFEKSITPFGEKMAEFSSLLLTEMKDITKVVESDRAAYSRALKIIQKNSEEIGKRQASKISDIIERWMDYSQIVSINLVRNIGQLSSALQKIDSSDIEKCNSGTLLILACIFRILYTADIESNKINLLIKIGEKYSETLESYADTIDILCNPEEVDMINSIVKK